MNEKNLGTAPDNPSMGNINDITFKKITFNCLNPLKLFPSDLEENYLIIHKQDKLSLHH